MEEDGYTGSCRSPRRRGSHRGSGETNLTSIHEDRGSIPGLARQVKDQHHGPELWCRSHIRCLGSRVAVAVA